MDATRREADADTDAKRASPSPSPAHADSGEARPADTTATMMPRGPTAIRDILAAAAAKKVPRVAGSDLAEKLRGERVHHSGPPHASAIDAALALRVAGDPEFDRVGHAVLMRAQAARMDVEPAASAGATR